MSTGRIPPDQDGPVLLPPPAPISSFRCGCHRTGRLLPPPELQLKVGDRVTIQHQDGWVQQFLVTEVDIQEGS